MKNSNQLIFLVFVVLVSFFIFAKPATAMTVVPAVIDADTIWVAQDSPYLIVSTVTVAVGAKLTIMPGAIIKSTRYGALEVAGMLEVKGENSAPVIFTSFHDDAAGGDTNNNGGDTLPSGGDWQWIKFLPGSSGSLEYAEVRYGGYRWSAGEVDGEIVVNGASPTFKNIKVHSGHPLGRGLRLNNSEATIEDSEIYGFYYGSVRVEGGAPILRRNEFYGNNWTAIEITEAVFSGQPVIYKNRIHDNANYGLINANPEVVDARANWWGADSGPANAGGAGNAIFGNVLYDPWIGKTPDPILVIPGILGSWQKRGIWRIDPILHTYDNLLGALRQTGYVDGQTLFVFPYDWKISNVLTAQYLRDRLAEIRGICSCTKIDIIAHSMGGLIVRQYISFDDYANDIDQVVFLGVPHRGAPKDYLAWEAGEIGPAFSDLIIEKIIGLQSQHLGYNNLFDYIHNYPISTIQELLPTYNYLRNSFNLTIRDYPNHYPTNQFLENLNSENALVNLANSRTRFINIVGDTLTNDTVNMIRVADPTLDQLPKWQHGYPENYNGVTGDHGLELGSGDKTVPLASATYFNVAGSKELVLNSDHGSLPSEAQEEIIEHFIGTMPQASINNWQLPNVFLLVRVFSPVDIQIIDPQGRRLGKSFANTSTVIASEAPQLPDEYEEIPNAFYSGFDTDNEFIIIPDPLDGQYQIQTQGITNGEFKIISSVIANTSLVNVSSTPVISDEATQSFEIEINGTTSSGELNSFDFTLNALETLAIELIQPTPPVMVEPDLVPPIITINSPEEKNYTRVENLVIDVEATDYRSGLASLEVQLDGTIVSNNALIDFFYLNLGNHTLTTTAFDFAGNIRVKAVDFILQATHASMIYDLERSYNLGWISHKGIKNRLVKMLEQKKPPKQVWKAINRWRLHLNDQAYNLLKEDVGWLLEASSTF